MLVPAGEDSPARAVAARHGIPLLERGLPLASGAIPMSGSAAASAAPTAHTDPTPGDIAVILLTSGSTGRVKIVPLTQRNAADMASRCSRQQPIEPTDRTVLQTPLIHSYAIEQLMRSVAAGARMDILGTFDPRGQSALLAARNPTWLALVPYHLNAWLRALDSGESALPPPGLRFIQVSGAFLPASLKAEARARFGVPVLDSYGSSEALCVAYESLASGGLPDCVGEPVTDLRIVGDDGHECPPGVAGEILVRGDTVFPGYIDDPALTAAVFTADGWFRIGDRGRLSAAGLLTVLGRIDDTIVQAGLNIDPAEIEAALLAHPAVAECVVFGEPHAALGSSIAAAVVLRDGPEPAIRDLRRWLLDRLSPHKIPRRFVFPDDLPRTPTGKIGRADAALMFRTTT